METLSWILEMRLHMTCYDWELLFLIGKGSKLAVQGALRAQGEVPRDHKRTASALELRRGRYMRKD